MSRKKSQQNRVCCYITFRIKPQQVAPIVAKLATKSFVAKRGTLLRFLIRALFATLLYVRLRFIVFRRFCSVQPRNLGHTHEHSHGCSNVFLLVYAFKAYICKQNEMNIFFVNEMKKKLSVGISLQSFKTSRAFNLGAFKSSKHICAYNIGINKLLEEKSSPTLQTHQLSFLCVSRLSYKPHIIFLFFKYKPHYVCLCVC